MRLLLILVAITGFCAGLTVTLLFLLKPVIIPACQYHNCVIA